MEDIKYTLEKFEELLQLQQRALDKAIGMIELKNELIDLLEEEIRIRKRQNTILYSILVSFCVASIIIFALTCRS
jgi:uncharacterized membrane protein